VQDCMAAVRDNSDELSISQTLTLVRQLAQKQFRNFNKSMRIQKLMTTGKIPSVYDQ
jgi:hypothetical protein